MNFKASIIVCIGFVFLCSARCQAQSAVVYWNNVEQQIDGFGASNGGTGFEPWQATFFFSTGPGDLGLSLLRTVVPSDGSCVTINATCAGQVADMQLAIAQGAKIWSTPFSPPASMKSNGSTICNTGSGTGTLNPQSYPAYAAYLATYVLSLKNLYGITLQAVSVQNEPTDCPTGYDGAMWTAANLDTFVKENMGPTFAANGLSKTLIMMPETSGYLNMSRMTATTMDDAPAAAYVGIIAWHDYDNAPSAINPFALLGKKYWETEVSALPGAGPSSCGGCWDPSITDAIMWAQILNNRMVSANANAWHYWALMAATVSNQGLSAVDAKPVAKRAYMMGNYSKFVRPGFYRIDATPAPQSGVLVSAYKNASSGALVIVVINTNLGDVSQTFTLNGTTVTSVTPWITSASLDLAPQTAISVTGTSFTYTLSGLSITSFVSSSTLAPPTDLAATVH